MYRTVKHRSIVEDPVIRYKPIESLPGIGPVHGRKLRDGGFYTADQILAKYLALKRNEHRFTVWLTSASGASAHQAAQCFSSLNEWHNTWGRDAQFPKKANTSSQRGSLTNRELLEQKMLQLNSNAQEDRLRSLFSDQTVSLVDISNTPKRPSFFLDRLNRSHCNIAENAYKYAESDRDDYNKKLSSPNLKSVNFKESVEFNAHSSKKSPIPMNSKRPISPILKSRSLTPELGRNSRNSFDMNSKIKSNSGNKKIAANKKFLSMNNLNITGIIKNKGEALKAKSIENMYRNNTFTKSKSKSQVSKKPEKLVCTCNFPYTEVEVWNSSETDGHKASQNIAEYFDEKRKDIENLKNSSNFDTTNLKIQQIMTEFETEFCKDTHGEEAKLKSTKIDEIRKINTNEQQALNHYDNSNEGDESDISSDYVLTKNNNAVITNTSDNNENGVTFDSRDLEDVKDIDLPDASVSKTYNELSNLKEVPEKTLDVLTENKETKNISSESLQYNANNFDNSNEDSGLDVTPKRNCDYNKYSADLHTTDDERFTPFGNSDSRSETGTDRTYEVNDTTDTESGFHFLSSNSAVTLERVEEIESLVASQNSEQQIDKTDDNQFEEDQKRTNIKLFCDMLSSDLEQLPMDRFRKLKLKILQMVYAEIDEFGEK